MIFFDKVIRQKETNISCFVLSFENTNCLRGIAILLIIIQHISGRFGTNLFTPLGGTGVAIFLFLSGFGLNESLKKNGLSKYWIKKIIRVFLPYFLFESVLLILNKVGLVTYLLDISGFQTSYWYVGFILKWYIIFYVLTKLIPKFSIYIMLIVGVIMLFTFPTIQAEQSFSFVLGVLTSVYLSRIKLFSNKQLFQFAFFAIIVGCIFLYIKQQPSIRNNSAVYIINIVQSLIKLPFGLSIILSSPILSKVYPTRFLIFVGMISYELYLVHMSFLKFIDNNILNVVFFIIVSFSLSYLFYKLNNFNSKKILANID